MTTLEAVRHRVPLPVRRQVVVARLHIRRGTAVTRILPEFLVLGAMRCGTSSLFRYLSAHPQVARPLRKEIEFFTLNWERPRSWYRAHFPLAQRGMRSFEATPYYLFHPRAAIRAAASVPGARLVVLLRDPVERALSHHRHMVRLGFEPFGFEEALDREDERIEGEHERLVRHEGYDSPLHRRYSYRARGEYAQQVLKWLRYFPSDHLHVAWSDDLYRDPAGTLSALFAFLGLDQWIQKDYANHSYAATATPEHTSRISISTTTLQKLRNHYRPHDAALEELLDRRVPWPEP